MKFWKISGPDVNENTIYLTTTSDCEFNDLITTLDKVFGTPDDINYFIEEISRVEYDEATINW